MSWHGRSSHTYSLMGSLARLGLVLMCAMVLASCGYALAGRGTFLPEHVRVIGVPTFDNQTPYFDIEQLFSEKVRSELIGRGSYTVLPADDGVDAVLNGRITSMSVAPVSFSADQQASRYVATVTASIELTDTMDDAVLWQNPSMSYKEEFDATSGTDALDPVAFFGQSSNALQRLSTEFAKALVSSILEAF